MRIHLAGVLVDDQEKALRFYTETLGFQVKHNIPLGRHAWITVVSEEAPEGTELVLEPDEHPAARPFKEALVKDGIPYTSFAVDDVEAEHERLTAKGVRFVQPPTDLGPVITAVFDDTCGNLIQIQERNLSRSDPEHPSPEDNPCPPASPPSSCSRARPTRP